MKKNQKQMSLMQQLLVMGSLCVVLAAGQFFLWNFVQVSADTLHTRRTEQQQLDQLQERVKAIKAKYESEQPLVDQLSVPFPKAANTPQVVDRLEQVAGRAGVRMAISNITSQAPTATTGAAKPAGQLTVVTVTLKVDGAAHELLEYVEALEHIQEVDTIQQWSLTPVLTTPTPALPGQTPAPQQYTMNMNVLFYLQP